MLVECVAHVLSHADDHRATLPRGRGDDLDRLFDNLGDDFFFDYWRAFNDDCLFDHLSDDFFDLLHLNLRSGGGAASQESQRRQNRYADQKNPLRSKHLLLPPFSPYFDTRLQT